MRAARALLKRAGRSDTELSAALFLEKNIPMGGGLGGGSSDAATTLHALNEAWRLAFPLSVLSELAAEIGSDVAFFLHGASSVCRGRGEQVEPIDPPTPEAVLLILPALSIPTPAVYRKFDELKLGSGAALAEEPAWRRWSMLSAAPLLAGLVNDLEPPAFALCPELATLRSEIEQLLGRIVRMSGSGSSLFTIYDTLAEAKRASTIVMDCPRVLDHPRLRCESVSLAPREVETVTIGDHR